MACTPETGPAAGEVRADTQLALGPADGRELPPTDLTRVQVGDTAPDFTLAAFDGSTLTLSENRGARDIILVFFRGHW